MRGRLGIPPRSAKNKARSYDADKKKLTVTVFDLNPSDRYLNQEWDTKNLLSVVMPSMHIMMVRLMMEDSSVLSMKSNRFHQLLFSHPAKHLRTGIASFISPAMKKHLISFAGRHLVFLSGRLKAYLIQVIPNS